ncbi:M56 family metallopeptidase [bacterium]|nr:M56 family metallopeptidase [bacterium]
MQSIQAVADFLIDISAKATGLLVLAWFAAWLLKWQSAALKHRLWSLTMLSLVLLPVVSMALPTWRLPILAAKSIEVVSINESDMAETSPAIEGDANSSITVERNEPAAEVPLSSATTNAAELYPSESADTVPIATARNSRYDAHQHSETGAATRSVFSHRNIIAVWAIGLFWFASTLLRDVNRTHGFCQQAKLLSADFWTRLLGELSRRLQLKRKVHLREHPEPIVPLACGLLHATIVLPKVANDWEPELQKTVFLHELAHIKRRDVLWQMIGRIGCTLFWFHPLAWLSLRAQRQQSEFACDDAVVHAGEKASSYAEQLLRVGELCCASRGLSMGVAMAEGNNLEVRVKALFDASRQHSPVRKTVSAVMLALCGILLTTVSTMTLVGAEVPGENIVGDNSPTSDSQNGPQRLADDRQADGRLTGDRKEQKQKVPSNWLSGEDALQRIIDSKPIFGQGKGLRLGIAWAKPQRVFRIGDRLPVELFLFNAGDREETAKIVVNVMAYPPKVVSEDGRDQAVSRLITFGIRQGHQLVIRPGEALVVPVMGLRVGGEGPVHLEDPNIGEYRMTYKLAGLTSGSIGFGVKKDDAGELRIDAHYHSAKGIASPERLSILKPAFGKAKRGIQMGLAFSTMRRTFGVDEVERNGETYQLLRKIPMDVFLRNVGDKRVSFQFMPDINWSPPDVVGPNGQPMNVPGLMLWGGEPIYDISLGPGEAFGVATHGIGVTRDKNRALSFVPSTAGNYLISYLRMISFGDEPWDSSEPSGSEDLTTGQLTLAVVDKADGQQTVELVTANTVDSPEANADSPAEDSKPPANHSTGKDSSMTPLDQVIWWEKVGGLQAGFLLDSPGLPNRKVPLNSAVKYRVLVRNTTDKSINFMARSVPVDFRNAPFLIPSDDINTVLDTRRMPNSRILSPRHLARDGKKGWTCDITHEIKLEPGESAVIVAHRGGEEHGLFVGDADAGDLPRIRKVKPGNNWIVQPIQIWLPDDPGYHADVIFEGLAFQTKVDKAGNITAAPADRTLASKGGNFLFPRIQLEVGTLNAAAARNANRAVWGKHKGLHCGVRMLNPKAAYAIGDTIEAEVLYRNTSDKPISVPFPRQFDLRPIIQTESGDSIHLDRGAQVMLVPLTGELLPGGVWSMGVARIRLVAEGTESPTWSSEAAHVTLDPGKYKFFGAYGVGARDGQMPLSGAVPFRVISRD